MCLTRLIYKDSLLCALLTSCPRQPADRMGRRLLSCVFDSPLINSADSADRSKASPPVCFNGLFVRILSCVFYSPLIIEALLTRVRLLFCVLHSPLIIQALMAVWTGVRLLSRILKSPYV